MPVPKTTAKRYTIQHPVRLVVERTANFVGVNEILCSDPAEAELLGDAGEYWCQDPELTLLPDGSILLDGHDGDNKYPVQLLIPVGTGVTIQDESVAYPHP